MTGHGFRAIASTVLNESGLFEHEVIEMQLAHKDKDKTRAAYNRAAYLEERQKMMAWWSNYLVKCGLTLPELSSGDPSYSELENAGGNASAREPDGRVMALTRKKG